MDAAHQIREAVARVSLLRQQVAADPALCAALRVVKRFQSARFAGSYADLLASPVCGDAARFFLDELYGEQDYARRDAQFSRIAGAIERLFPAQVAQTAVAMAELHATTEELDHAMALAWLRHGGSVVVEPHPYVVAWREVGCRPERERQLGVVLVIGREVLRLTRLSGLRTMLWMLRAPAAAAGLGALQQSLERGYDTFAAMAKRPGGAEHFLAAIETRETALIDLLFDAPVVACETELAGILGQAR
jgi:hypothetical protein